MTTMRALLIGVDWLPHKAGGLNRYFYDLVHALPAAGVSGQAVVLQLAPEDRAPFRLRSLGGEHTPLRQQWRILNGIVDEAVHSGVEIINPHFAKFAYPWIRRHSRDIPIVVNFQGPWADEMRVENPSLKHRVSILIARHMERTVYRRATRLITLSEAFRDLLCERYGVDPARVQIVAPGVNVEEFSSAPERQEARQKLGWPEDRRILLAVRRLTRRMGLESLVEAMETVRRDHPDSLLLIAGRGMLGEELDAQIARRGLGDHVKRIGFLAEADLPLAYAAADVTVVPTVALEGFGLITAESLNAGTPVMGTPVGGTPEILRPFHPDLLFDDVTAAAIADKLTRAFSGTIALPDREACRAYAAKFNWERAAAGVRGVFDDACLTHSRNALVTKSSREPKPDNRTVSRADSAP